MQQVLDCDDEVEVKYLKAYKGKLIWPEEDDISVEPRQNVFVIPRPVLIDKKRQFFQVPDGFFINAKAALNIVY